MAASLLGVTSSVAVLWEGVAFGGCGSAIGVEGGSVEVGCALEFALRTGAGMEVGALGPRTDGTG